MFLVSSTLPMKRRIHRDLILFGPPGHGKTTLLRALRRHLLQQRVVYPPLQPPGWVPPYYQEAETKLGDVDHTLVDCASLEDWWKLVVSGTVAFDGAILVASLVLDPPPEIEAQLRLLPILGVKHLIVHLNHADVVDDPDLADRAESTIRALVAKAGRSGEVPLVRGAAKPALDGDPRWVPSLTALAEQLNLTPQRPWARDLPLLFCIEARDRVPPNRASVSGRLVRGHLRPSQEVAWIGAGTAPPVRVERLSMFGKPTEEGFTGDNLELRLSAPSEEAPWAHYLAAPGSIEAHRSFLGHVVGIEREHPFVLYPDVEVQCGFDFHVSRARVVQAGDWGPLRHGEHRDVEIALDEPMVLDHLTRFALRQGKEAFAAGLVLAPRAA